MYKSTQSQNNAISHCNVHTVVFLLSQTAVNYHQGMKIVGELHPIYAV